MSFNIGQIRANLQYGGARPTLFQVSIVSPFDGTLASIAPFMVQATEIPAFSVGAIEVPYMGRKIRVAGDRTFDPWRVSVLNDEDFKVRHSLETWSNKMNSMSGNMNTTGSSSPNNYKVIADVKQYAKSNETTPIRVYRLYGAFPTDISSIDLDWNNTNTIETFSATFSYDWCEVVSGTTGTVQ